MKYYKFLNDDMVTRLANFKHPAIGEWTDPVEGELEICDNGYHVATEYNCVLWLNSRMFEVECVELEHGEEKSICRQERLVREIKVDKQVFVDIANEAAAYAASAAASAAYAARSANAATYAAGWAAYAARAAARASASDASDAAYAANAAAHATDAAYQETIKKLSNRFLEMVGEK